MPKIAYRRHTKAVKSESRSESRRRDAQVDETNRNDRSRSEVRRNVKTDESDRLDDEISKERPRSSQRSDNGFVNITKLFESRKNPDNLVGTCKLENLEKLLALITDAEEANSGVAFFVFLQGKWGPSLCASVAREQQDQNFNDGSRSRNWRR